MSHYAKLVDGTVEAVLVGDPSLSDAEGLQFMIDTFGGTWVQTSYNAATNGFRGVYAGIGYTYNEGEDIFVVPQPYPSWTLNQTSYLWEAPVAMPEDGKLYSWNEDDQAWVELVTPTE